MKAYHGDYELKAQVMKELAEHREADRLVKGRYWENGKGCAVGCLVKSDDHELFSERYGIPVELVYLNDRTFERLENHLSQQWPERFMGNIEPGADLSKVHLRFIYWLLTEFIVLEDREDKSANAVIDQCRVSIASVSKLLNRCINDENVSENEWSAAQTAAETATWAAWAVAWAAVWAVQAAAWAAMRAAQSAAWATDAAESVAWEAMSNKLIELIKECEGEKE